MEVIQQIGSVLLVLALLAGTLWWLRRRGPAHFARAAKRGRQLELVDRLPLGPQHSLHLVRIADRALLVAVSPSGCRLLETSEWKKLAPQEALP
ncbi:MAG: flagellar biosynthetic protein FliO [Acidobacteria bacterium]|nr:flagellar biosynthetic protein FliO [Acidobacteriota bacterium]